MKTYLDCYPCFLRQALEAARLAGADEAQQYRVLMEVAGEMRQFNLDSTPPEMAHRIHRITRRTAHNHDPYQRAKQASTRQALAMYPDLKALVAKAEDPLETAVRLSIAGNIIDLGMGPEHDNLESTVERVLAQPFAIGHLAAFREALISAQEVLFLADNAGETVFDRILIETLETPVTYVVKGGPILNDATREDAVEAGLDQVAAIIDTGCDVPGTILHHCSPDFCQIFGQAELVIAKGQGNYESLSGSGAPVFFLLQAKCPVIAQDLGVPVKSVILKQERASLTQGASEVVPRQSSHQPEGVS
jgi:uncharacterized protein with ATP-grasp and redox domains